MKNMDDILQVCIAEASHDFVGLWEVVDLYRRRPLDEEEPSLREAVLTVVRNMLDLGFVAVDIDQPGGCTVWPDQNHSNIIHRIESEWLRLGRPPNIAEIVYFWLPSALTPVGPII